MSLCWTGLKYSTTGPRIEPQTVNHTSYFSGANGTFCHSTSFVFTRNTGSFHSASHSISGILYNRSRWNNFRFTRSTWQSTLRGFIPKIFSTTIPKMPRGDDGLALWIWLYALKYMTPEMISTRLPTRVFNGVFQFTPGAND